MAAKSRALRLQQGAAARATWRLRIARFAVRRVLGLVFQLRLEGGANMPRTPVILCANHLGWMDVFLIMILVPVEPRIYILGEEVGVVQNDFRAFVINALEIMVPLDRAKPLAAIRQMADLLRRGGSLLMFPEGHLGAQEGVLQPLQSGAAHLSLISGVPLLPVGLTGTRELWLRRPLTVRIGPPLDPAAFPGDKLRSRMDTMTAALDSAMRALLPGDPAPAQTRRKPLRTWLTNLL